MAFSKKAHQSEKTDIRQEITDKIIKMIEDGGLEVGKRWTKSAASGFPLNAKTGAAYRGVNVLILWAEALEAGYSANAWMTYKQAAELGAQVRKGEKGVKAVYFEMVHSKSEQNKEPSADGEENKGGLFPMSKAFTLFNIAQIDGLPEVLVKKYNEKIERSAFNPIAEADRILINSGAVINHGGNHAFYRPAVDAIQLPEREAFASPENYYATALHELTHWTGHTSRLARDFSDRFGDGAYAFEELIAELGAAFVVGNLGFIDVTIENHASYIDSWLKVLRNDKTAIFSACKQAWLASDFILETGATAEQKAA